VLRDFVPVVLGLVFDALTDVVVLDLLLVRDLVFEVAARAVELFEDAAARRGLLAEGRDLDVEEPDALVERLVFEAVLVVAFLLRPAFVVRAEVVLFFDPVDRLEAGLDLEADVCFAAVFDLEPDAFLVDAERVRAFEAFFDADEPDPFPFVLFVDLDLEPDDRFDPEEVLELEERFVAAIFLIPPKFVFFY
jgi:hypothetical protein